MRLPAAAPRPHDLLGTTPAPRLPALRGRRGAFAYAGWNTDSNSNGCAAANAVLLQLCGPRVLVLEQHYVPGGFTHAFRRKGYVWDVGVHAVGEVTEHSMPGRLHVRWHLDKDAVRSRDVCGRARGQLHGCRRAHVQVVR